MYKLAADQVLKNSQHHLAPKGSHLHFLLQKYLPVAQMEDDALLSEFSDSQVRSMRVDLTPRAHCGIVVDEEDEVLGLEVYDTDESHQSLVRTFEYTVAEMDDPYEVASDEVDRYEDYSALLLSGEEPESDISESRNVYSSRKSKTLDLAIASGISEPTDAELVFTKVMGATRVNNRVYSHPVLVMTNEGLITNDLVFDPGISPDRVFIAPVSAGFNAGARRYLWWGRPFKAVSTHKPLVNPDRQSLGSVLDMSREHVSDTLGNQALSMSAVRPLARAHLFLGTRELIADAWPVSKYVSLAVATTRSSARGKVVRGVRNWAHGNLGTFEKSGIALGLDLLTLFAAAPPKKGRNHVRHIDFVLKYGAPEPLVLTSERSIKALHKLIIKRTLEEEPTVIFLEEAH
jgi:hypothetical protein